MRASYEQQKALAMAWKNATPALARMRHADIRRQNNAKVILGMGEISKQVLKRSRSRVPWGFVQMYKILARGSKG
jgi:CMP-2-keto-3-deoxyoctulosonic acid synthetase